jgi:proline dehydrogenase
VKTILGAIEPIDRVTFGSHNVESVELLKSTITNQYPEKKQQVYIGQIYGFSDHLTFNLADEGF